MDLSPEQRARFVAHLDRCNTRQTCELCDAGSWEFAFHQLLSSGLTSERYRVFTVTEASSVRRTCRRCGLISWFDATIAGFKDERIVDTRYRMPAPLGVA
jgi:predicted nucleic-acid-binding Zn-ribbon protein